jgi:AraC-like DNA-binding protein
LIELPFFSTEFHFHKECQIVYVVESEGKRIIGDSVESFTNDELILLGSDIPHVWHNDKHYFEMDKKEIHARSIAVFFHPDKLIEGLSHFTPVKKLEAVLLKARRGVKFLNQSKHQLRELLIQMTKQKDFRRLITFIKVLELISTSTEFQLLASEGYINTYQARDNDRIDKVFKYVFSHFTEEIHLEDVAALANMNKQSFCRYFKSRTQKTLVHFVNEVRIGHACRLIAGGETHIAGLAYQCGYNSISNFNHFFKEIKGVTPREHLKMMNV